MPKTPSYNLQLDEYKAQVLYSLLAGVTLNPAGADFDQVAPAVRSMIVDLQKQLGVTQEES